MTTYTVMPVAPITISLKSSTNVNCNGTLGCANFDILGGSGIYTGIKLQYLDPASQSLTAIVPANNNYYNICNLKSGLYYLTVVDSKGCSTQPYSFTIYDNSTLAIESVTLDSQLCQDKSGKVRVKVKSLDSNLTFYYNDVLTPFTALGKNTYELSINNPSVANAVIKVKGADSCWDSKAISTQLTDPGFEYTSQSQVKSGYQAVHESIEFNNSVDMDNIPAEYDYVTWDFGDNSPFKVFFNPDDLTPNASGENFKTVFHSYANSGVYNVTMSIFNSSGCSRTFTKMMTIGDGASIMTPTIFTPNGDGINDYFQANLSGVEQISMYIYNEWGNLVYEFTSDVKSLSADWGWNGIEKTKSVPVNGSYRYFISGKTKDNKTVQKEGRFMLVK
jgi:gliding motility-associated-like protein